MREGRFGTRLCPSWDTDRRGGEPRNEASGVVLRMRAQRASFEAARQRILSVFNKERRGNIRSLAALALFSTTPLASFLGSLPLLSQEGQHRATETFGKSSSRRRGGADDFTYAHALT